MQQSCAEQGGSSLQSGVAVELSVWSLYGGCWVFLEASGSSEEGSVVEGGFCLQPGTDTSSACIPEALGLLHTQLSWQQTAQEELVTVSWREDVDEIELR